MFWYILNEIQGEPFPAILTAKPLLRNLLQKFTKILYAFWSYLLNFFVGREEQRVDLNTCQSRDC